MIASFLLLLGISWAECPTPTPSLDGAFEAAAPAAGAVLFELRLTGASPDPTPLLKEMTARDISAILLPSAAWAEKHPQVLRAAVKGGHEVGLWFSLTNDLGMGSGTVEPELGEWVVALRKSRKRVQRMAKTKVRSIGIHVLPPTGELAMEAIGFRALLPDERTVSDQPRRAEAFAGNKGQARIIGEGGYEDGCGPLLPSWSPAALDRATSTVARGRWVRIRLPVDGTYAPLLGRWLDEVVVEHKWLVLTGKELGHRLRDRNVAQHMAPPAQPTVAVARTIDAATWRAVAESIADVDTLPHTLPGGLNLTEAWYGLCTIIAAPTPPESITLGALHPPVEIARAGLSAPVTLELQAVQTSAQILAADSGGSTPALVTVGTTTLTAAEFIQLLARISLQREPVASPVADPDPFAPGGGWGQSAGL